MSQLLKMSGCKMEDNPKRGGQVPICDEYGRTSIPGYSLREMFQELKRQVQL